MFRRQMKRQTFAPADPVVLAALSRLLPRTRWRCFRVSSSGSQPGGQAGSRPHAVGDDETETTSKVACASWA